MAAVDALPLVQELEKALACLDAVEKDVDEGTRPGKDMDAFFQQLGRVDDAAAALPEMPIPQGALDDGADLDASRDSECSGGRPARRPRGRGAPVRARTPSYRGGGPRRRARRRDIRGSRRALDGTVFSSGSGFQLRGTSPRRRLAVVRDGPTRPSWAPSRAPRRSSTLKPLSQPAVDDAALGQGQVVGKRGPPSFANEVTDPTTAVARA